MMQCEKCKYANKSNTVYCQRCGAPLPILVPYHPSIEDYISPPEAQFPLKNSQELSVYYVPKEKPRPAFTPLRTIFFFMIAIPLTSFGIFSTFSCFGSDTKTVCLAFFAVTGINSASIILFFRTRRHQSHLRWSAFLLAFLGTTLGAFILFCLEVAAFNDGTGSQTGTAIACSILTLYGLSLEGIALW